MNLRSKVRARLFEKEKKNFDSVSIFNDPKGECEIVGKLGEDEETLVVGLRKSDAEDRISKINSGEDEDYSVSN